MDLLCGTVLGMPKFGGYLIFVIIQRSHLRKSFQIGWVSSPFKTE